MPEQVTRQHRRRNPVAQAAILRKGGVHEKSRKSKRQKEKRALRKTVSKAMATYRGHFFCLGLLFYVKAWKQSKVNMVLMISCLTLK